MSFLNAHIGTRTGESSLTHSNSIRDASDRNVVDIITDSSVEELQYTEICDLVNNKTAVKADCNDSRSPTPSVSHSSKSSSRTQRDKN